MQKHPALVALGTRIRELRKARDFSQEAFSNELGLDRSYYGGIERGERNVAALNLILIAKRLKVEVGELFPSIKTISGTEPRMRKRTPAR